MRPALACLLFAATAANADDRVTIDFGSAERPARLSLVIPRPTGSANPDTAFLIQYFDFLDRNGDGSLSADEVKHLFALPVAGRPDVKPELSTRAPVSRDAFLTAFREAGFRSVAIVFSSATDELRDANLTLSRALDTNGDGILTRRELEAAPQLLRRFDENEDETLSRAELRRPIGNIDPGKTTRTQPKISDANDGKLVTLTFAPTRKSLTTFSWPSGDCLVEGIVTQPDSFRETRTFYQSLYRTAAGTKASVRKETLEQDPLLAGLLRVFDLADRNADGMLELAELNRLLDLAEAGLRATVTLTLTDNECDWFGRLDTDGNGRLDERELAGAVAFALPASAKEILITALPRRFALTGTEGPTSRVWGPLTIARPPAEGNRMTPERPLRGPLWFQAMDRNADGFVSHREFAGPPERFKALDANGDGRISIEEAEAASKSK